MADLSTTTQITPNITGFYNKTLLERAIPYLAHQLFADKYPVPANSGTQTNFRRYTALAQATTPLTEGVNPTGKQLAKTDINATLKQYGDFVYITDLVQYTVPDKVLTETAALLGEQAGQSIDSIDRDIFNAGTSVYRANAVAGRINIITKVATADLDKLLRAMRNANARYWENMINPSTGIATVPIRSSYFAIAHPDLIYDLEALTGWVNRANYADPNKAYENEVGSYKSIRVIESTNAKIFPDTGGTAVTNTLKYTTANSSCDVYTMPIFGQHAVAVCDLQGRGLENIIKPLGWNDALDQYSSSGWKSTTTAIILNDSFMYRYECGVSA